MPDVTSVRASYDALAFAYDALTAEYPYDRWLAEIEGLAEEHGLAGRRVLDVACGTGKSFLPLQRRGFEVTGTDVSPAMLERAAAKAPDARMVSADMRKLPVLGSFDLVTCLDDALNYVVEPDELVATFRGLRRNLATHGVAIWDVNTLSMYGSEFATDWVRERDDLFMAWRGSGAKVATGGILSARLDVFASRDRHWARSRSEHRQRHWPVAAVTDLATAAGLHVLRVVGQQRGAVLGGEVDEQTHTKAVFVARRGAARDEEVST